MKHKPNQSIDGFTLRRRHQNSYDGEQRLGLDNLPVPEQFIDPNLKLADSRQGRRIGETNEPSDVDTALGSLDVADNMDTSTPKPVKKRRLVRFKRPKWLTGKRLLIGMAVLVALIFGYLGIKAILAGSSVLSGNLLDIFSTKPLKQDQYGRTNIVLFGTSEDSRAHQEGGDGADLTDSIQIISLNQTTKDAVMFSVPRDLWVNYGQSCSFGYEGKINAVYECAKEGSTEVAGAKRLMEVVGETFGLEMHYWTKVNYKALEDAVDAVGGITVSIDSDDPRGIYDPNFDWQCNHQCNLVKHPNGPAKLNGEEALALSRARNAAGGYGLAGGNFDREANQQKIIIAIKDKAVSAGTLSNPVKVSGLIDTLGKNVRSNFVTGEVRTLVNLAQEINPSSINQVSLVDVESPVMTVGDYYGQSIVMPVAGIGNFSDVQRFIQQSLRGTQDDNEDASIAVLNATDTPGVAARWQRELSTDGVFVNEIGDAPTGSTTQPIEWYNLSGGNPQTAKKLQEVLGVPSSGSTLPDGVQWQADFVILIGNGAT